MGGLFRLKNKQKREMVFIFGVTRNKEIKEVFSGRDKIDCIGILLGTNLN